MFQCFLSDEKQSQGFAEDLAQLIKKAVKKPLIIFLKGDLGTGKTTIVRAFLRELGVKTAIKSPTYAIVESYTTSLGEVFHFDLYRLSSPEELEYIGIRDYLDQGAICCFEWPERAQCVLPKADIEIALKVHYQGRELSVQSRTAQGAQIIKSLRL